MASSAQSTQDQPSGNKELRYVYEQLAAGHIRILKLLPAKDKADEVCAELQLCDLSADLNFEALSYVWGEPIFPVSLRIGNSCINITDNLSSALRQFRRDSEPRAIWVDLVCIDQNNIAEKNIQVPLMGRIYRHAKTVLAWLGELPNAQINEENIKLAGAIAFVGRGIPAFRPNTSIYIMDDLENMIEEARRDEGKRWSMAWSVSGTDRELNPGGVRALYESAWFTRIWIVQEAALAHKLVLYYGAGSLDWDDFERICMLIFLFVETSHAFCANAWEVFSSNCWRMIHTVHDFKRHPHLSKWFKTVATLGSHACRDDTDRVYALLSLLPEELGVSFTVDYAKHPFTVYTEAATLAITNCSLEILYSAGAWRRNSWDEKSIEDIGSPSYLPTWVPEYNANCASPGQTETTWWMQTGYGDYNLTDAQGAFRLNPHSSILHCIGLEGSLIGKVVGNWDLKDLNDANKGDPSMLKEDDEYHQIRALCLNLLRKIQTHLSLPDDMSWKLTVLRAMLACVDTNTMWSHMGETYNFNKQVLSIHNGLNIYYKLVLADEGAIQLLKSRDKKAESKNTPISELSEEMKAFVSGIQELMSIGTVNEKDHVKSTELGEDLKQIMLLLHSFIGTALRKFTIFAFYNGGEVGFAITPPSPAGCSIFACDVAFIDCCKVPFILRPAGDGHFLISPCYISQVDFTDPDTRKAIGKRSWFHLV